MATAAMMQNQQAMLTSRRSTSTASTKRGCGAVIRTTHRRRGGVVKCRAASDEDDKESGGGGGEKMVVAVTGATGKGRPLVRSSLFIIYFFSLDFKKRDARSTDELMMRCTRSVYTVGKTSVVRDETDKNEGGVTLLLSE